MLQEETIEKNKINEFKKLTISEQVLYSIESVTELKEPKEFKEEKEICIIGGLVGDLILTKNIDLIDGKIKVLNNEKTNFAYLNNFMNELDNNYSGKDLNDVLLGFKNNIEKLENAIRNDLIKKSFLKGKKTFGFLRGSQESYGDSNVIMRRNLWTINLALRDNSEPEKKLVFILALLDAINFLKNYFKTSEEYTEKTKRLLELIESNPDVKLVYKKIKNDFASLNIQIDEDHLKEFSRRIEIFQ